MPDVALGAGAEVGVGVRVGVAVGNDVAVGVLVGVGIGGLAEPGVGASLSYHVPSGPRARLASAALVEEVGPATAIPSGRSSRTLSPSLFSSADGSVITK